MTQPQHMNYKGDVTHLIGEKLLCPYYSKDGTKDAVKTWVITGANYNVETNRTRLELDEVTA